MIFSRFILDSSPMSSLNQKTIKKAFKLDGIGLHTGKKVSMKINPAEPNSGIIFKRTDLKSNNIIIPNVFNVSNASYCTTITNELGVSVSTIEHLMGAFYGIGIDNALVEIDSQEIPIMDGSAKIFVEEILKSGIQVSETPIKIIKIEKEVNLNVKEKNISIKPSKLSLEIDFEIKNNNPLIGTQRNIIDVYKSDLNDVFNSRTFCLYEDIEKLRSNKFPLCNRLICSRQNNSNLTGKSQKVSIKRPNLSRLVYKTFTTRQLPKNSRAIVFSLQINISRISPKLDG